MSYYNVPDRQASDDIIGMTKSLGIDINNVRKTAIHDDYGMMSINNDISHDRVMRYEFSIETTLSGKTIRRLYNNTQELSIVRDDIRHLNKRMCDIENDIREQAMFFAANPHIKEQYDEVMSMCKLGGMKIGEAIPVQF